MKIAVMSCIHGNYEALNAVLSDIDRLSRMDANQLFCGRSGLAFEYKIESGRVSSQVQTLDKLTDPTPTILSPRRIIGVGSVGRVKGKASYTLYHLGSNKLEFKTVCYSSLQS